MDYDFKKIESKWQLHWKRNRSFETLKDFSLPKKYILSMFPYPSGRLHMGHVRNYAISDAIARFWRKENYNVLHPIGWDAFGLPAENAAIKNKSEPSSWTRSNINVMREQLQELGFSFAYERELATCDYDYTKWEQYLFIKFYNEGLIYRKKATLNYCQKDETVLANEQVINNHCWRCDEPIVLKELDQYYFKIKNFQNELLDDLKLLKNNWPDQVIKMQENWIGKTNGYTVNCNILKNQILTKISKFSIFIEENIDFNDIAFINISYDHPIVKELLNSNSIDINKVEKIKLLSNDLSLKDIDFYELPIEAVNPFNTNKNLKIVVTNYAHIKFKNDIVFGLYSDNNLDRDMQIANKLNIKKNKDIELNINDLLNKKIIKNDTHFKLKDWGISRQRFWGTPIPLIHCDKCGIVPEKIENLPVKLPEIKVLNSSRDALTQNKNWINTKCPKCDNCAKRETDTLDTFMESSWYFLRFTTTKKDRIDNIFTKELDYFNSVDQYIGGIEHAILHLLYARFFTKILKKMKIIKFNEPFNKLLTQGMVLKDGAKMSKSKGNVIDPSELINKYGADTARLFILFAAPPENDLEWSSAGVEGSFKFIKKLITNRNNIIKVDKQIFPIAKTNIEKEIRFKINKLLEKYYSTFMDDNTTYSFNTIIALTMEILNDLGNTENYEIWTEAYYIILNVLEPFIPHIANELSQELFLSSNLKHLVVDKNALVLDYVKYAITINGKVRGEIQLDKNVDKDFIIESAKKIVSKWLENKKIIKEIFIKNKLINFVIKD
nr:class I tRNA ligase family protein [Mycoplasma elephantis]